ncbi:AIR synthase-related protein, partial [Brevibacterium paucivorans]
TLTPEEILMSESQERMMAVVRPEKLDEFMEIVGKWEVETSVLGEVTDTGRLVIEWHGDVIVDVPPRSVAHDGRVDEETGLGIALATDANGRYTFLDPATGAQLALAEAYRNVATTGARP